MSQVTIAVAGCIHGELNKLYDSVSQLKEKKGVTVDLLLCCGDFQALRSPADFDSLAVPHKYRRLMDFHDYYAGRKTAPVLTVFVGGNHEASNYLWDLYYGGWVAPNIYYMGSSGVVDFAGLRIGGISGIYKGYDYRKGYYEQFPLNKNDVRSIFHVREFEVFKMRQVRPGGLDVMLSHDWPLGIADHGDKQHLFRMKKKNTELIEEVRQGRFGSPPLQELIRHLRPPYWFAAHIHTKFAALMPHPDGKATKFLALDKVLPGRDFLQVVTVDAPEPESKVLRHDPEWLAVVRSTISQHCFHRGPPPYSRLPATFTPSPEDVAAVREHLVKTDALTIPCNFSADADPGHLRDSFLRLVCISPQHVPYPLGGSPSDPMVVTCPVRASAVNPEEVSLDLDSEEEGGEGDNGPARTPQGAAPTSNPEEVSLDVGEEVDGDLASPGRAPNENAEEVDLGALSDTE